MTYIIIALAIAAVCALVLTHKQIVRVIAEKRALPKIEKILFAKGEQNKAQVLRDIHSVTNNRLSDEMAIDYFYKIKGLQVLSINQALDFWVRTYLTTPPKVKLNYFEQVRFYETFLNYPNLKTNPVQSPANKVGARIKAPLIRKLMPQKMA